MTNLELSHFLHLLSTAAPAQLERIAAECAAQTERHIEQGTARIAAPPETKPDEMLLGVPSVVFLSKSAAVRAIRVLGLTAHLRDGEIRVTIRGIRNPEDIAYYTNDANDAYATALHMADSPLAHSVR